MKLLGLLATRSAPIMQYDVPPPHRVRRVAFGVLSFVIAQAAAREINSRRALCFDFGVDI